MKKNTPLLIFDDILVGYCSENALSCNDLSGKRKCKILKNGFPGVNTHRHTHTKDKENKLYGSLGDRADIKEKLEGAAEWAVEDRRKEAHQYDGLFGKRTIWSCLPSEERYSGQDSGRPRSIVGSRKGLALINKRSYFGSCDPLSRARTRATMCALTHVRTPTHSYTLIYTHAVTHQ